MYASEGLALADVSSGLGWCGWWGVGVREHVGSVRGSGVGLAACLATCVHDDAGAIVCIRGHGIGRRKFALQIAGSGGGGGAWLFDLTKLDVFRMEL